MSFLDILGQKSRDDETAQPIDLGTVDCIQFIILLSTVKQVVNGKYTNFFSRRLQYLMRHKESLLIHDYPLQFVWHRWMENEVVAKGGRGVWIKIVEVVKY